MNKDKFDQRAFLAQTQMPKTSSPYVMFRSGYKVGATEQRAIDYSQENLKRIIIEWENYTDYLEKCFWDNNNSLLPMSFEEWINNAIE